MRHSYNELQTCSEGKILKVSGGDWTCMDDNACSAWTHSQATIFGPGTAPSLGVLQWSSSGAPGTTVYLLGYIN